MSANLPPKTPAISQWLKDSANLLADDLIPSARLDVEIILAHTLKKSRTWLHAHGDERLDPRQREIAEARLELRREHTPIAYIIGHKDFYGRRFRVTPSTLIPRPESEALIELLHAHIRPTHQTLIDVGSGSGCLGITAKLEFPDLAVTLSDISHHAIAIAEKNAAELHATVNILETDLLPAGGHYDIVMANLPYVDITWTRNAETEFEPPEALFADEHGLALIAELTRQAEHVVPTDGLLILEADPQQHTAIIESAATHHFTHQATVGYGLLFCRA